MKKILLFIPILLATIFSACKKDDVKNYSNPHIENFYFDKHAKISGIENIQFTVDTFTCVIFNEDSASYNCDFSRVLPVPDTYESLSSISVNGKSWRYIDTINMNSPITITTVGGNKKRTATYTVTINKHTVEPDSIIWVKNIINENSINSIKSSSYNNNIYLFFSNNTGETKVLSSNNGKDFNTIYSNTELNINFYKSIIHNEKCFASSNDNKSLFYMNLSEINEGFKQITLPENAEIVDLWGVLNGKLFATLLKDSPIYMSFNGTEWVEEKCNMLNELTTLGSTKINNANTLYIISGELNGELTNNVLATQDGNYWINTINQSDTLLYEPVKNASIVDYYNYFYICGGITKNNKIATSYYSKNDGYSWLPLKSYQRPANGFAPKENMSACALGDYIYIFNCSNSSNIEVWKGKINKADFIRK
jgi:hypothetical protein